MKFLFTFLALLWAGELVAAERPNLVYILCDDLGYGDVQCLNPEGKIATPHMDRVGREGMIFTDAHSGSAVCTPTRYGVMTGRYAWRSKLQSGVLGGLSPRLIEPARKTVAAFLKQAGYHTACIGKWHLGMDWVKKGEVNELNIETREQVWNVDYAQPITNGPRSLGFDYYFGISASLDMVPYCFIENERVTQLPTEDRELEMIIGQEDRKTRQGPAAPGFTGYEVLPTLRDRSVQYIKERAADAKAGKPFFLYVPLTSPHTPILPQPEWQGKSGLNPYADFVMATDEAIGRILRALDETGLAENTMVILTSDNGCSPSAKFDELEAKGHRPSYHFRGNKADIYEGGHRVPFLVRWPAQVKAGQTSSQLVCLTDFMATVADITESALQPEDAVDSYSFLPALLHVTDEPTRPNVIHHSVQGAFSIREGDWKLILAPGSGGWSEPRPGKEPPGSLPIQLYDLSKDVQEKINLGAEQPELVQRLTAVLEKQVSEGRSTPGAPQPNAVSIELRKKPQKGGGKKSKPSDQTSKAKPAGQKSQSPSKAKPVAN